MRISSPETRETHGGAPGVGMSASASRHASPSRDAATGRCFAAALARCERMLTGVSAYDARRVKDGPGMRDARTAQTAHDRQEVGSDVCDDEGGDTDVADRQGHDHGAQREACAAASDPAMTAMPACCPPASPHAEAPVARAGAPSPLVPAARGDRVPTARGAGAAAACADPATVLAVPPGVVDSTAPGRYTVFPNAPGSAMGVAIDVEVGRRAAAVAFRDVPPELMPRLHAQRPRLRASLGDVLGMPVVLEGELVDERGDTAPDRASGGAKARRRRGGRTHA